MRSLHKPNLPKYIGYRQEDYAAPYSKFYNENIAPIPAHVEMALWQSPYSPEKLLPLSSVTDLLKEGYTGIETGYTLQQDGSVHVAVLTAMPGVKPYMWDWWFSWHGSHANRYKLWHPGAHQCAAWKDGNENIQAYIGRTSLIEEYIGKRLEKASIHFVAPPELGLISTANECFICARIGFTGVPLYFGWLVHQVRVTESGAEMRSRFWIGGRHIQIHMNGRLPELLSKVLQKIRRVPEQQASDLLIHCAEEMNHLAAILPRLYAEFYQSPGTG